MYSRTKLSQAISLAIASGAVIVPQHVLAQESGSRQLTEIVVTASRRESSLQDTSVAVQAFDSDSLKDLNLSSFQDYLKYTANLQSTGDTPGMNFVEMRGVGANGANILQAGAAGSKASVAQYLDDTALTSGAPGTRSFDVYLTDVERVEVLGGPQGTLFGSGSLSGAVRTITNKPDPEGLDAGVKLSISSTNGSSDPSYGAEGFINFPLIKDRSAVRIVAYNNKREGYLDNSPGVLDLRNNFRVVGNPATYANTSFTNFDNLDFQIKDVNFHEYTGGRISANFAFNDEWKVTGMYAHQQLDVGFQTAGANSSLPDLSVEVYLPNPERPEHLDDAIDIATLTLEGRLSILDVIYVGSFLKRDVDQTVDYSNYVNNGGAIFYSCTEDLSVCGEPRYDSSIYSYTETVSHELRFSSDTDKPLSFIGGVYAFEHGCDDCGTSIEFHYYPSTLAGFLQNAPVAPPEESFNPNPRILGTTFFTDWVPDITELSFFGDVNYRFNDWFNVSVGARHYDIEQTATGSVNFGSRTGPSGVRFTDILTEPLREKDTIMKYTLNFTPSDDLLFYLLLSEGYSIGSFNRNGGTPGNVDPTKIIPLGYNTEVTTNYEFGWKSSFADGRGRFNGAIYHTDWEGLAAQVLDLSIATSLFFINGGDAKINGAEGNFAYLFNDSWSLAGNFAAVSSEITRIEEGVPASLLVGPGNSLPRQPVFSGNLTARYDFEAGGHNAYVSVGTIYKDSAWSSLSPTRVKTEPYTLWDVNFGVKIGENWDFSAFVHNLTDERFQLARSFNEASQLESYIYGRPRTFGVSMSYDMN